MNLLNSVKKIKEALKEPFQIKINFDCHADHSIIMDIYWINQDFTWTSVLDKDFKLPRFIKAMEEVERRLIAGHYK